MKAWENERERKEKELEVQAHDFYFYKVYVPYTHHKIYKIIKLMIFLLVLQLFFISSCDIILYSDQNT